LEGIKPKQEFVLPVKHRQPAALMYPYVKVTLHPPNNLREKNKKKIRGYREHHPRSADWLWSAYFGIMEARKTFYLCSVQDRGSTIRERMLFSCKKGR